MEGTENNGYEFGPFRLLPNQRLLLRNGRVIPLTPRVFDTLLAFVENSGRVLSKDELMQLIWPGTIVEEGNLSQNIFVLRKSLGENPPEQRYIVTLPLKGYRFIPKVTEVHVEIESDALRRAARERTKVSFSSLAVLPLKFLGDEKVDPHLGIGIADALVTILSRVGQVIVRPTTAVLKYFDSTKDPLVAGREQAVDAVLDGVVQQVDRRLRVSVQLIRVDTQETLWADQFEENLTDSFALQDSISKRIARLFLPELTRNERQDLFKYPTDNGDAYYLYIKGQYLRDQRTEHGLQERLQSAQQMISLDPKSALAYACLADSYKLMGQHLFLHPADSFPKARVAAIEALEIDDSLAEAHASLADVALFFDWNWSEAERRYQRAIRLNPHSASAHHWYAWFLITQGRLEEARSSVRRARMLDPGSLIINTTMALPDYYQRHYDRAIFQYQQLLQLDFNFLHLEYHLGSALVQKHEYNEAVAAFTRILSRQCCLPTMALLGHTYGLMGEKKQALEILDKLESLSWQRYTSAYLSAVVFAGMGHIDDAFVQLERAYTEHAAWLVFLRVDPFLDPLRDDSRFARMIQRVGFTP